jgi:hypothetical protein
MIPILVTVNRVKIELEKDPDIYTQVVGLYTFKIYKIAKQFLGGSYPNQNKLYDVFMRGIQTALYTKALIKNKSGDMKKEDLQRIFPKFVLPKCKEAFLKEKNIFLPMSLPRSCTLDYVTKAAKKKGISIAEFLTVNMDDKRGIFTVKDQPNMRNFYALKQNFLNGQFCTGFSEKIHTVLTQKYQETDVHTLNIVRQTIFGQVEIVLTYVLSSDVFEIFDKLSEQEKFIIVSLYFEKMSLPNIAEIFMEIYGTPEGCPEKHITKLLNNTLKKLKKGLA